MAKKSPDRKAERAQRQAQAAAVLAEQRAAERRRNLALGLVAAVVLGLVVTAALTFFKDNEKTTEVAGASLTEFGVPAAQAQCAPTVTKPAKGNGEHRPDSEELDYGGSVPAFGPHYNTWAPFARKFYTVADRPRLGNLVHNLEHGYTVVWYAEDLPTDQVADLKKLSAKFAGANNANMVIVAPWTAEDGTMEAGKQIALTHWSADPDDPADKATQEGVWQYCGQVSGEAIGKFLKAHPWRESPEPGIQ